MSNVLITGIAGQDGSYLAELLLSKGYEVHGIVRREALEAPEDRLSNLKNIIGDVVLHEGSVTDHLCLYKVIKKVLPTECYHLAASSYVSYGFNVDLSIMDANFNATYYLLSAIRELTPTCRVFFAGSSEMFGNPDEVPQAEESRFNPKTLYGIAKVASHQLVRNYREQDSLFVCTGIMYNHESPRRALQFVTRKITSTVAKIKLGYEKVLHLGNIDAERDWGYAGDYVNAMYLMLQHDKPDDYVVASGSLHTVRDLLTIAFGHVGLNYEEHLRTDPTLFRPSEKRQLVGDSNKIRRILGWQPTKTFQAVISEMVDHDLACLKSGRS